MAGKDIKVWRNGGFPYTSGMVAAVSVLYQPASRRKQRAGNGIGIGTVSYGSDTGKL